MLYFRFLFIFALFLFPATTFALLTEENIVITEINEFEFASHMTINGYCENISDQEIRDAFLYAIFIKDDQVISIFRQRLGVFYPKKKDKFFVVETHFPVDYYDLSIVRIFSSDDNRALTVTENTLSEGERIYVPKNSIYLYRDIYGNWALLGRLINNSPHFLQGVFVDFTFFDADKNQIGTAETALNISLIHHTLIYPYNDFYFVAALDMDADDVEAYASFHTKIYYNIAQVEGIEVSTPVVEEEEEEDISAIKESSWGWVKSQITQNKED